MGGRRGAKKGAEEVEMTQMVFACSSGCIGCFYHLFLNPLNQIGVLWGYREFSEEKKISELTLEVLTEKLH